MKQTILKTLTLSMLAAALIAGCKGKDEQVEPGTGDPGKEQSQTTESNPEAEKAALECAEKWLALVDRGEYQESWEETAGLFKQVIPVEQWRNQLKVYRGGLGKLVSRELRSKEYATTLPGAADGQYVVIRYKSSFEKKNVAGERIVPMLDEDGTWRVSGYYIE